MSVYFINRISDLAGSPLSLSANYESGIGYSVYTQWNIAGVQCDDASGIVDGSIGFSGILPAFSPYWFKLYQFYCFGFIQYE